MKITVGIPSRGRALELAAAVLTLDKLKSDGNDVRYLIARDRGDVETEAVEEKLIGHGLPIDSLVGDRPCGLGELHNGMAAACDPDAVFLLWTDRCVPITHDWDHAIAIAALQFPQRVLWLDSIHLIGAGQFILPPAWRAALPSGKPCPGYFPFWFEDSHVEEMDAFVHGFPRMACYAQCAGPRTARTNRMRDLEFWIRFYAALRPSRIEEARQIARNLGIPWRDPAELVAHWERRDADFLARASELTDRCADLAPPDESYRRAKGQAVRILRDLGHDPHSRVLVRAIQELEEKSLVAEAIAA